MKKNHAIIIPGVFSGTMSTVSIDLLRNLNKLALTVLQKVDNVSGIDNDKGTGESSYFSTSFMSIPRHFCIMSSLANVSLSDLTAMSLPLTLIFLTATAVSNVHSLFFFIGA